MKTRYVLMTRTKSKYEDFYRIHFSLFDSYYKLQKHLGKFWYIEKNNYVVFRETSLKKDYSTCGKVRNLYE